MGHYGRRWTEEEENYLLDSFGQFPMMTMMKKLNRTEASIVQKLQHLTGTRDISTLSGLLSTTTVAEALGVTHRTINNWIVKHGLPASKLNRKRYARRKSDTRIYRQFLNTDNVWEWIAENKERVRFQHIQRGILVPEPDWLEYEIKKAKRTPLRPPKNWTPEEDESALLWDGQGVHYKEIASRLQRPIGGTYNRIARLRKQQIQQLREMS